MPRVYVSIGSNIEREKNIRGAVHALRNRFGTLLISSVYETTAVGFEGDPFYNLVLAFDTDLSPRAVADALREIETAHGRTRGEAHFAARTLDLDFLLYGDAVVREETLSLPRAEILKYAFVLGPLAEIAPDLRHPVSGETYARAWERLEKTHPMKPVHLDL